MSISPDLIVGLIGVLVVGAGLVSLSGAVRRGRPGRSADGGPVIVHSTGGDARADRHGGDDRGGDSGGDGGGDGGGGGGD